MAFILHHYRSSVSMRKIPKLSLATVCIAWNVFSCSVMTSPREQSFTILRDQCVEQSTNYHFLPSNKNSQLSAIVKFGLRFCTVYVI